MQLYGLLDDGKWSLFWSRPRDQCAVYGQYGAYGSCNSNNIQFCSCVEGFTALDDYTWASQEWWSGGCVRQSQLNCDAKNSITDGFVESSVTLPDVDSASSFPATSKKDCQKACFVNCSCPAFSFSPPSGRCHIWSRDLLNMHQSESKTNSNVFIRVAASALPQTDKSPSSKRITTSVVLGIVGAVTVTLAQDFSEYYFPAWAATQIYNGNVINIVEEGIAEERDLEEVRRASIVALLCIEQDEEVRPSMGQVVLMLEGKIQPQIPQIQCSTLIDNQADRRVTDSSSES
ncbi:hypothetical protein SUGI_0663490 [Cryptomeria japonica]|nr:hypothetical protein SUGI_0663490 [Cryptomeria japonica]